MELTHESIRAMSDEDLNGILRRHAKRGPYAWAVSVAEDELENRRKARREEKGE